LHPAAATGQLSAGFDAIADTPILLFYLSVYAVSSFVGVSCYMTLVKVFSSALTVATATIRKFLTVFFSSELHAWLNDVSRSS
jgi:hypothetical protein